MGDVYLDLTLANLKNGDRQKKISFLVDTGASRAWISQEVAGELGIESIGTVPLELADGSIKNYPYGFCLFNFEGETIAGNVVIGPSGCEPLVGTHVLQDFRLIVNIEQRAISRGRAMRAKRVKQEYQTRPSFEQIQKGGN